MSYDDLKFFKKIFVFEPTEMKVVSLYAELKDEFNDVNNIFVRLFAIELFRFLR